MAVSSVVVTAVFITPTIEFLVSLAPIRNRAKRSRSAMPLPQRCLASRAAIAQRAEKETRSLEDHGSAHHGDENGGYWNSSYIQSIDLFVDSTRIPIAASPFSTGGQVKHGYMDHVSILKFFEKDWGLPAVSSRSRDNLPNPRVTVMCRPIARRWAT
jgi:hypothetical protein